MTTKTYRARSISDALSEVKRELGRDAVILRTRSLRKGGFLGIIGGKPMWEIVACPGSDVKPAVTGKYVSDATIDKLTNATDDLQEPLAAGSFIGEMTGETAVVESCEPQPESSADSLSHQVAQLRQMVELMLKRPAGSSQQEPSDMHGLRQRLISQDVKADLADSLLDQLRMELTGSEICNPQLARMKLEELIAARIPTAADDIVEASSTGGRVIALIGPTGVGKTTTIAKLAANYKLRKGMRVGLITIDTYRIAAVDQLRTYADIIEVPLRTVLTPEEMKQAIYALRGMDVILLDTTGRSQNDLLRLKQLRSYLDAAQADQVHLVVSAAANYRCSDEVLHNFAPLGASHLLVTKLDEASGHGAVLNIAASGIGPITYVTTGQEVPDDITQADAAKLARKIVGGSCDDA